MIHYSAHHIYQQDAFAIANEISAANTLHIRAYTKKGLHINAILMAPQVGLEPTTTRLTAECSAIELLRNIGIRQRPILPGRVQPSTFGTEGLNFCVRNGNRWDPFVITTGNCELVYGPHPDNCTSNDSLTDRSIDL